MMLCIANSKLEILKVGGRKIYMDTNADGINTYTCTQMMVESTYVTKVGITDKLYQPFQTIFCGNAMDQLACKLFCTLSH